MSNRRHDQNAALQVHLALHLNISLGRPAAAGFLAQRGVNLAVALRVLNRPAEFRREDAVTPCYPIRSDGADT